MPVKTSRSFGPPVKSSRSRLWWLSSMMGWGSGWEDRRGGPPPEGDGPKGSDGPGDAERGDHRARTGGLLQLHLGRGDGVGVDRTEELDGPAELTHQLVVAVD